MQERLFDKTTSVPEIGIGCWQSGGGWKSTWDNAAAQSIYQTAYEHGARFWDTADVYGVGGAESEQSVGQFRQQHDDLFVATKLGRNGIYPDGYTQESLLAATNASRERLQMDSLDLTQLHCVPTEELRKGDVFNWLRDQREAGLIKRFGASVETVEEGLICLGDKDVASLQVIFNVFRQKPARELFDRAADQGVAIIVRLPLASGLLTGKMTADTTFDAADHRNYNKDGAMFNVGETFAGLPFETGVSLAAEVQQKLPGNGTMAQKSLRWILDHPAVTVIIPGASRPQQAIDNIAAAALPPFDQSVHQNLAQWYDSSVASHIRGPY